VWVQTRSGSAFSPWAPGAAKRTITAAADVNFDFEQLVSRAVAREWELEDDDTEGDELESALSAILLTESPPLNPSDRPASNPPMSRLSRVKSKPAASSTEAGCRKCRSHMKRAVQRQQAK
jgi:hypothetical protein